jgi:hypothetical protein
MILFLESLQSTPLKKCLNVLLIKRRMLPPLLMRALRLLPISKWMVRLVCTGMHVGSWLFPMDEYYSILCDLSLPKQASLLFKCLLSVLNCEECRLWSYG